MKKICYLDEMSFAYISQRYHLRIEGAITLPACTTIVSLRIIDWSTCCHDIRMSYRPLFAVGSGICRCKEDSKVVSKPCTEACDMVETSLWYRLLCQLLQFCKLCRCQERLYPLVLTLTSYHNHTRMAIAR